MPNDLAVSTTALSASALRADPITPETTPTTDSATTAATAAVSTSGSSTLFANPSLQLNADLGIVVIQLRDAGGSVNQIPSQRQLDAYISGSAHLPGTHPAATSEKQTTPAAAATTASTVKATPTPAVTTAAPVPAAHAAATTSATPARQEV